MASTSQTDSQGLIEDIDVKYRRLFKNVSPSVVIVEQVGRISYFCIGSVILSEGDSTFILTQSAILNGDVNLSVRFSDSLKQPAMLFSKTESLCILKTKFHNKCKPIEFFEGIIDHSFAISIAPATKTSVYNLSGHIVNNSFAQSEDNGDEVQDSESNFVFDTLYGDQSPNCVSRLFSGSIFNMDAKVLGIVMSDLKYRHWPILEKKSIHRDYYYELGFRYKVVMCASRVQNILRIMFSDVDWKNGLRSMAKVPS